MAKETETVFQKFGTYVWENVTLNRQPTIWFFALVIGLTVAHAAIGFWELIRVVQWIAFRTASEELFPQVALLPWWQVLFLPAIGGVFIGLFLQNVMGRQRMLSVADVIESRTLHGGRVDLRTAMLNAVGTSASLGVGASAGREGPVVHLGAAIASEIGHRLGYSGVVTRTLLGCGVAAAVSASFNAPLAGVLFALEVVLGHYALRAFGPIVISSVAAAVTSRIYLGEFPAFIVPVDRITTYWEMPAFALLGLICGLVAMIFMRAIMYTDDFASKVECPLWMRPAIGGLMLGAIAIYFPQVLGVGYGATDAALNEQFGFTLLVSLIVAKTAATAITMASRFGGGVFSPSLYLGAMTGGAFGILAAQIFPDQATSHAAYALVGMGAVSAAVLGAPISTTLIVFELTGEWRLSLAVLVAVSIATVFTQSRLGKSFFHWQLERRGLHVREGAHAYILKMLRVRDIMETSDVPENPPTGLPALTADNTLGEALKIFDETEADTLLVYSNDTSEQPIGLISHTDALKAFNRALIERNVEEHR